MAQSSSPSDVSDYPQVTFADTKFTKPSILSVRRKTVSQVTLRTQLQLLRSTGRYDCFKLQWHKVYDDKSNWPVPPHLFWDSDVAKWIEAACYFLHESFDEDIDHAVRELVDMIRSAQQDDGYLNLHYIVVEPEKRWSNLRDMHELYNAGHLIEAAVAHCGYYKNDLLTEPLKKYIKLIRYKFGPEPHQIKGYPGHPEIELALLRFYSVTGDTNAYKLAKYFLTERGNPKGQEGEHYYDWERKQRGESPWTRPDPISEHSAVHRYCQAHLPIREQPTIEGHSVRAMYLYTAVADLICLSEQSSSKLDGSERNSWVQALRRLWDNMVDKKMYVTGGIGAVKQWEGFGIDYALPQGTDEGGCYSETCASIGVMMLAERLLHFDLNGHYADIMEICLYNNIMTAMSLDGKAFTYANQLASSDKDTSIRSEWFECACCPPNVARLYGSLGGYLWDYGWESSSGLFVNVHLFANASLEAEVGKGVSVALEQQTHWPWDGKVVFQLSSSDSSIRATIRLRLPAWANGQFRLSPSASSTQCELKNHYVTLDPGYVAQNPSFTFEVLGFEPRYLSPHPYTNQRTLALARGPIVYCAEDTDNSWETNHFKDVVLRTDAAVTEEQRSDPITGEEYVALRTRSWTQSLASGGAAVQEQEESRELTLVPYYFRANRGGKGHMRVGMINGGMTRGHIFPQR